MLLIKSKNNLSADNQELKKQITTYCVRISYDGSNFFGWSKQIKLRTVEGEINQILSSIFNLKININGVSRTDSGVHAYDQIFTFSLPFGIEINRLKMILNQHFHQDIKINDIKIVDNNYDVRKHVKYKEYRYYINCGVLNPFAINYQYQYNKPLSIFQLKKVLKLFVGEQYFYNFSGLTNSSKKSFYRTIKKIKVYQWRKKIIIIIQARGFLRYQIRYLVAAAINYCENKVSLEEIKQYLDKNYRKKYDYPKAPAQGLYLYKVVLSKCKKN